MKYHIRWTKNSKGNYYKEPVNTYCHYDINTCHKELSSSLTAYPLAKGEVEECNCK